MADGEIMKNECKCNGNCQCGKHPCLIDDMDCLCRLRGQSYPKMNCDGMGEMGSSIGMPSTNRTETPN